MENTPEGRVVNWFKKKVRKEERKKSLEEKMREKPEFQDLQKHLK